MAKADQTEGVRTNGGWFNEVLILNQDINGESEDTRASVGSCKLLSILGLGCNYLTTKGSKPELSEKVYTWNIKL